MDWALRSSFCEEVEIVFFLIHREQNCIFVHTPKTYAYTNKWECLRKVLAYMNELGVSVKGGTTKNKKTGNKQKKNVFKLEWNKR
jgi:hypothetical protein